jgi:enediyne biosynthesis protein E4
MWRRALPALAVLLVLLAPPAAGAPEGISVTLTARRLSIRLGQPLSFRVEVANRSDRAESVEVSFVLQKVGRPGAAIPFGRWVGVLPPGGRSTVRRLVTTSQWFPGAGRYRVVTGEGVHNGPLAFRVRPPRATIPRFQDVTVPTGLSTTHLAPVEQTTCNMAAGAAWGDVEGDGDLDLYLTHQNGPAQLWVNENGAFIEEAASRGVDNTDATGIGAVFVDVDNDGDQDLYVTNDGPNRLYRNDGAGSFQDVAPVLGIDDPGPSTSASWADYDNDGRLDLYVANYGRCGGLPHIGNQLQYAADRLYHQEPDGTFTDRTALLGPPEATLGAGFQGTWVDFDHDGDQDLYLANDFVGQAPRPNVLWRNDGPGGQGWRFTDVSVPSRAGVSINTMGVGVGDYDRDGSLDLALSNIRQTVLLHNEGDGTFSEQGSQARVARPEHHIFEPSVTWGLGFADLNGDSLEDLYVGAGAMGQEASPEPQPNAVFINTRSGAFLDVSARTGADDPSMTRGVAFADYDRDGRVDLYLVNRSATPRLLRNVTPRRGFHWLEVDTVGTRSNTDGCGAQVTARLRRGPTLVREVFCGSTSLASGSDPTVHFGLGRWRSVRRLTIEWPSGMVQTLQGVAADRIITVTEPVG